MLELGEGEMHMRTTRQFSITLPIDMAEVVEGKIKSGAYTSVSEVVRDAVRALLEREAAVERWFARGSGYGAQGVLGRPCKGRSVRFHPRASQVAARPQSTVTTCAGYLHGPWLRATSTACMNTSRRIRVKSVRKAMSSESSSSATGSGHFLSAERSAMISCPDCA